MSMLSAVAEILQHRRSEGWLVGGSVRDRLLGRYSPDLDIAVADDAQAVAAQLAETLRSPWFALSERHHAYRVLGDGGHVDIASVRGGSILTDLAERDFTVNAMAVPVRVPSTSGLSSDTGTDIVHGTGEEAWDPLLDREALLDPFGGVAHLRKKRLVAISEHIFADDPLRLLRASRFCHTLGLEMDDDLAGSVRGQAETLAGTATERVVTEMCLTLAVGRAAEAVRRWHELDLLRMLLPGSATAARADVRNGTTEDVYLGPDGEELSATLAFLERLDDLLDQPARWFPETGRLLEQRLAISVDGMVERPIALRLAVLIRGLAEVESEAAGRRLKLSGAMVSLLRTVSRSADGPFPGPGAPTREVVMFLWNSAPWEPETIALAAVEMATGGAGMSRSRSFGDSRLSPARRAMSAWAERVESGVPRPPVDGEVLMRELGMESGPLLGRVLREVRLAWESGEAVTASEALAVARAALQSVGT
jgi:poly(A) polymerase